MSSIINSTLQALKELEANLEAELDRTQGEILAQTSDYDNAVKEERKVESDWEKDLAALKTKYENNVYQATSAKDYRISQTRLKKEQAVTFIDLHQKRLPEIEAKIKSVRDLIKQAQEI